MAGFAGARRPVRRPDGDPGGFEIGGGSFAPDLPLRALLLVFDRRFRCDFFDRRHLGLAGVNPCTLNPHFRSGAVLWNFAARVRYGR
jgi:hypothetical protein